MKILKKNQKSKDVYLRETWITNRVMLVFAAVVLGLWGFNSLVDGLNYAASYETGLTAARITLALFALATLGSLALVWKNRDAEQEPFRVVTPDLIAGICAVGALGAWLVLRNFSTAMQLLYVLLPALAVGADIMKEYGVDTPIGRTVAIMLGSTETTFYTISVYFGAAGIRKTRYTLRLSLRSQTETGMRRTGLPDRRRSCQRWC